MVFMFSFYLIVILQKQPFRGGSGRAKPSRLGICVSWTMEWSKRCETGLGKLDRHRVRCKTVGDSANWASHTCTYAGTVIRNGNRRLRCCGALSRLEKKTHLVYRSTCLRNKSAQIWKIQLNPSQHLCRTSQIQVCSCLLQQVCQEGFSHRCHCAQAIVWCARNHPRSKTNIQTTIILNKTNHGRKRCSHRKTKIKLSRSTCCLMFGCIVGWGF